jgi:hypothetical protein
MLFNTKQKSPDTKSSLKWNESFVLKYHTMADTKLKLFTVSLNEIRKDGAKVVGNERTFKLDQFDPSKTYDLNIEVKKNFKVVTDANIVIKVQYIKNLRKQAKLSIEELKEDKKHYYELLKYALVRVKELKQNPTWVDNSQKNGGWYHQEDNNQFRKSKTLEKEQKQKTFVHFSEANSSLLVSEFDKTKYTIYETELNSPDKKLNLLVNCNNIVSKFDTKLLNISIADEIKSKSIEFLHETENIKVRPLMRSGSSR